ncbi:hypothetical protein SAMN04487926_1534 [Paraburkholderia steynii]|uniref:Uncharacterized protein n=1 Tax=Paraburkholderia steynii TaxID=1245441 RepID=A0A7Z7FNW3_9BURK|nr:hypothetical protein [Paraburkholderia steynii]SDJ46855.1 hypothetical protein SAMN04487926_1534 [Paraburkholderia steynii]
MSNHHVASTPVPYTHSFRIELTLENGKAEVSAIQHVAMRAQASRPMPRPDEQSGVWVELVDESGHVLYWRSLRMPHMDSVEVFDDEQTGKIIRVPQDRKRVKLDVILPDLPNAAEVILFGAENLSEVRKSSVPLLRVSIPDLRRKAITPPRQP